MIKICHFQQALKPKLYYEHLRDIDIRIGYPTFVARNQCGFSRSLSRIDRSLIKLRNREYRGDYVDWIVEGTRREKGDQNLGARSGTITDEEEARAMFLSFSFCVSLFFFFSFFLPFTLALVECKS